MFLKLAKHSIPAPHHIPAVGFRFAGNKIKQGKITVCAISMEGLN